MKVNLPFVPRVIQQQVRRYLAPWVDGNLFGILDEDIGDVSIKSAAYPARVRKITSLNSRSVQIELQLEDGYRLHYRAGQSVCLTVQIGNTLFRRYYAISSSPEENRLTLAIKKIVQGRVSTFVNRDLHVGDRVYLEEPFGDFVLPVDNPFDRRYVMVAAGSGIVPVYSMIKDLLGKSAMSRITLVYCNRSPDEVMYRRELEGLAKRHSGLKIHWHYSRRDGYSQHMPNRLTGEKILSLIADAADAIYYVCAPAGLTKSFMDALAAVGVAEDAVKMELFSAPAHVTERSELKPRMVVFEAAGLLGGRITVEQKEIGTILDAAREAGVRIPQDCTMGNCKTCKLRVSKGVVVMDEPNALSLEEAEDGGVLACVAYPCENVVVQLPRQ